MKWRAWYVLLSELTPELPSINVSVISLHHTYNMQTHDYSYLKDFLVEEVIRTAGQAQVKETFDKGRPLMRCGATQQSIVRSLWAGARKCACHVGH